MPGAIGTRIGPQNAKGFFSTYSLPARGGQNCKQRKLPWTYGMIDVPGVIFDSQTPKSPESQHYGLKMTNK